MASSARESPTWSYRGLLVSPSLRHQKRPTAAGQERHVGQGGDQGVAALGQVAGGATLRPGRGNVARAT
jgi:hypothetical protein